MTPNIYESPSESLNIQLQKQGFCWWKELKPLRAAGEKIKPVKPSAFSGCCATWAKWKVGREGNRFTKRKWKRWQTLCSQRQPLTCSEKSPRQQTGVLGSPRAWRGRAPATPQINSPPPSGGENREAGVWLNLPAAGASPLLPGGRGEDGPHSVLPVKC